MHKSLFIFVLLFINIAKAQNLAYYVTSNYKNADLVLVNLDSNQFGIKRVYAFGDTIQELLTKRNSFLPDKFLKPFSFPKYVVSTETSKTSPFSVRGFNSDKFDSVKVKDEWHKFFVHQDDDGFVGGRPNQTNRYIVVNGIGLVYSESNYMDGHKVYMYSHQDTSKQRILFNIYDYVKNQYPWFEKIKISTYSQNYRFNKIFQQLKSSWFESHNHLKNVSVKTTHINKSVNYKTTIKNTSQIAYYIPINSNIGPSRAILQFEDSAFMNSDLRYTISGRYYKNLNENIYLNPGQEVEISHQFSELDGCQSCIKVIYEGCQVKSNIKLLYWLTNQTTVHKNTSFTLYNQNRVFEY
jgi:hypothetical protein